MLRFLKGLFARPEEIVYIKFTELGQWFDKIAMEEIEKISSLLNPLTSKYKSLINETNRMLDALENANLKNQEIAERAKQLMEGNRKTYIKRTRDFLISVNRELKIEDIDEFHKEFQEKIMLLNQSTTKSYYVLQEFFAHESREIALRIKNLEEQINSAKEAVQKSAYHKILEIRKSIENYNEKARMKRSLLAEEAQLKKELADEESATKRIEEELEKITKADAYSAYSQLINRKNEITKEILSLKEEINTIIQGIEPLLRHLNKNSSADIIELYLAEPYKAFCEDKNLEIASFGEVLDDIIESERINLSEKRIERAKTALTKLKNLGEMAEKNRALASELHDVEEKIIANPAMQDYTDADYKLNHMLQKIERINREIEELKRSSEKINLQLEKERLREKISAFIGKKVIFE
ncbi:MAG: hypothetical protein QXK37_00020 [Candidatus Woesearchaeota archaeon]